MQRIQIIRGCFAVGNTAYGVYAGYPAKGVRKLFQLLHDMFFLKELMLSGDILVLKQVGHKDVGELLRLDGLKEHIGKAGSLIEV